ncbi:MAG TPA: NYN domain-containing protein [Methylobacter sp.]|jgi:uncharacterized LabA/DUF88 family protein
MKTIIYVDGFNFYYGALKKTPYKWLDLHALFTRLLASHNDIVAIKYFTARVSPTPSDPDKHNHQDAYIRALQQSSPKIHVYFGQFTTHNVKAKLVTQIGATRYVDVIRTNEKGSDVNLAVHLLNDAWLGGYDCAVMVSGDSDLVEAIRLVKTFHARKVIGLFASKRGTSKEMLKEVDFTKHITAAALAASQFPDLIPGTNIKKPSDW